MLAGQRSLFGNRAPAIDRALGGIRRVQLDANAWLDHRPGWVEGHQQLLDHLVATTRWQHQRVEMYERTVDVVYLWSDLMKVAYEHIKLGGIL